MLEFIIGTFFGIILSVGFLIILGLRETKKRRKMLNQIDKLVDNGGLKFHSRVKNIVYITGYEDYSIIYLTDMNKIAVMKGVSIILNHDILISKNTDIATKILNKFNTEINDITEIGGVVYSKNIVGGESSTIEKPTEVFFDTDKILEQITDKGIESLSKEQKEWLDNLNDK